jgi:broad specificity phosphatase PhoE
VRIKYTYNIYVRRSTTRGDKMIYFLRHGLDDETYIGGWSKVDLIPEGIKQVQEISKHIKDLKLNINKIYSSDVKRAVSTAKIVSKELNIKPELKKELRELNKGLLTGIKVEIAKTKHPELFDSIEVHDKYPEGESMLDLHERTKALLEDIIKEDNILIVTHRGVINMMYYHLHEIDPCMNKERFQVTHASLHELNPKTKVIRKIK